MALVFCTGSRVATHSFSGWSATSSRSFGDFCANCGRFLRSSARSTLSVCVVAAVGTRRKSGPDLSGSIGRLRVPACCSTNSRSLGISGGGNGNYRVGFSSASSVNAVSRLSLCAGTVQITSRDDGGFTASSNCRTSGRGVASSGADRRAFKTRCTSVQCCHFSDRNPDETYWTQKRARSLS